MVCLADRAFVGFELWRLAVATGADLLWRVRANHILPCQQRLPDGSYLSRLYASPKHRRHDEGGQVVRVIEYRLEGMAGAEPLYRLVTTLLDPAAAPATELAALYHERWESEGTFAEFKVSLARAAPDAAQPPGGSGRAGGLRLAAGPSGAAPADP